MGLTMKIKFFLVAYTFLVCFPTLAFAHDELVIQKEVMYWTMARSNFTCTPHIQIEIGEDVPDLRDEVCGTVIGSHSLTLSGPAGTTVTLYGDYNFKKDNGFLTIRKKDDQMLWLMDLTVFPDGQWFSSEADQDSGAFDIFYKANPRFERIVSSVQWGDRSVN